MRRSASSSAGGLENGSKHEYASSVAICVGDGVGDVVTAVADVAVPQAGHGVDQLGAVGRPEQGALAANDGDERRPGRFGEGMEKAVDHDLNVAAVDRRTVARERSPICNPRSGVERRQRRGDGGDVERSGVGGPRRCRRCRRARGPPPDVVVIQEIGWWQSRRLSRRLGMERRWAFKHFRWPGPEGLAVLTPHRIVGSGRFVCARSAGGTGADGSPSAPRSAVDGTRFDVINVHLSPHDDGEPAAARPTIVSTPPAGSPAAGHRRRLQRRSERSRSGRFRRRRMDRRMDARPSRRRRRIDELDGGEAARPAAHAASRLRLRPRRMAVSSTPRCWRRRIATTGSPSAPITFPLAATVAPGAGPMNQSSDALLDKIRKLLAKAEAHGQRQRGRGVLGEGGTAHRRASHRPGATSATRSTTARSGCAASPSAAAPTFAPAWRCSMPSPATRTARSSSRPVRRGDDGDRRRIRGRPRRHRGAVHVVARPGGEPDGRRCADAPRQRRSAGGDRSCSASPTASPSMLGAARADAARSERRRRPTTRRPHRALPDVLARTAQVRQFAAQRVRAGRSPPAPPRRPSVRLARRPSRRRRRRPRAVTCRRSAGVDRGVSDDRSIGPGAVAAAEDMAFGGTGARLALDRAGVDRALAAITAGPWWRSCADRR